MVGWTQVATLSWWLAQVKEITATEKSEEEAKMMKEVMYIATVKSEEISY